MIKVLGGKTKQCRDVNVDSIGRDFLATQFKYIGKGIPDDRSIVSGIGHLAFTTRGFLSVPTAEQLMLARAYGCKKARHSGEDRSSALHCGRIAKPKLRIRRQKLDKSSAIRSIDGRKQALPPIGIWRPVPCELTIKDFFLTFNHRPSIRALRTGP
jgi:hypothetical protein